MTTNTSITKDSGKIRGKNVIFFMEDECSLSVQEYKKLINIINNYDLGKIKSTSRVVQFF